MIEKLPIIYLAPHGEAGWSLSGQHTGLTDLPLTERGELNAQRLAERLRGFSATKVFTSPLQRAARTCELAGFSAVAEIGSRSGRMELRRIRGTPHCRYPEGASGLAIVS